MVATINFMFDPEFDDLEYYDAQFTSFYDREFTEEVTCEGISSAHFAHAVVVCGLKLDTNYYVPNFQVTSIRDNWCENTLMCVHDSIVVHWNGVPMGTPFLCGPGGRIVPYTRNKAKKGTSYVLELSPTHSRSATMLSPFDHKPFGKFNLHLAREL